MAKEYNIIVKTRSGSGLKYRKVTKPESLVKWLRSHYPTIFPIYLFFYERRTRKFEKTEYHK